MNFLRKILTIAVVAVFAGNTEGMNVTNGIITALPPAVAQMIMPNHNQIQLDFNSIANNGGNVPASCQPKIYRNPVIGAPDKACVYFTVMNDGNPNNVNVLFQNAAIANPVPANEVNIYFPADGHQPTTEEAVEYSCANIDNRENSPITDWYMRMFGLIAVDFVGWHPVFITAGHDATVARQIEIIIFNAAYPNWGTLVNDPDTTPGASPITQKDLFIKNFRKIASTSVGRTLLYRILIEIRRHIAIGDNTGCFASDIPSLPPLVDINDRNKARYLKINWGDFAFDPNDSSITIQNVQNNLTTIGKINNNYTNIPLHTISIEVSLFHELLHWYHFLRHMYRRDIEVGDDGGLLTLNTYEIGQYLWHDVLPGTAATIAVSSERWKDAGGRLAFEEMRTIIGVPLNINLLGTLQYFAGDDISENLYRMCIGLPLRYGYDNIDFYEDNRVIYRVISVCNSCKGEYTFIPRYSAGVAHAYRGRNGLGHCKIL